MEKKQAQEYIKQVLNSRFDLEQFELFMRNLLNEYEPRDNSYSGNLIPEAFREHITHYKRIGKYTDPEGEVLDILVVQTRSVNKLERTRTALRNFVVRHLKNFEKQYALVAFYSKEDDGTDWRLSLVKIDYESAKNEKGKIKVKEDIVPAKRFSYLVGENEDAYTAQKQLLPLLVNDHSNPLIVKEKDGDGSIEGAFSIEKVTDEFYEQYKELYLKLTENIKLTKALEKEGLDPVRFVKKLLGQIVFLYFLQKKGWLGVPKDKKMGEGSKRFLQDRFEITHTNKQNYFNDFLRYLFYAALAREHNDEGIKYYFKQLTCKIPFLNGGLFEADYDWEDANITIPNELFRNTEKNKSGDKGTGILDVFDRYNFTIKEDEPLEKEVAVDPEMLGKVFENMLEITERKSKGAYYTPREIVHYMCQESLIHYLENVLNEDKTAVPKEDIEQLVRHGHLVLEHETTVTGKGKETRDYKYKLPESIRKNAQQLDDALASIKICDPAIGSGAFPVGLLQEIVTARLVLNSFLQEKEHTPYNLKRHAIQESIYGVDIDASAIDIARLRLWLSMIVDEEDYDTIEALPNLDYKIVCGNSLIGMPENAMRNLKVEEELEKLKKEFFHETDETEKKALRHRINGKIRQLLDSAEQFAGYKIDFDFKLFFSEVWHYKGGFDVTIGNPPYGVSIKGEYRKIVLKQFDKVPDYEIYYFFIELSKKLLHTRGILSYIIPNTILFNVYAEKYRESILRTWRVIEVLDCTNFKLFESAVVRNVILVFSKSTDGATVGYRSTIDATSFSQLLANKKEYLSYDEINLFNQNWGLAFKLVPETVTVIKKIKGGRKKLSEINPEISQGLIAYDKYRGQSQEIIESRAYHFDEYTEGLKKWLLGEDVTRYNVKWNGKHYIDYSDGIANPRDPKYFIGGRVLVREITNPRIYAAHTTEELYNDPAILIVKESKHGLNKYSLTAILNSDVASFLHFNNSPKATKGDFPKILITDLKDFPIVQPSESAAPIIIILVKFIEFVLLDKRQGLIYAFYDQLLNAVVYELFFPEELQSANKQIVPHLSDLKDIRDDMSNEEKLAIIQSEFERLYDPNHPVRNNLETLDSVEEVRIIKEALK